jgi:steroid delta-isomerase
LTVPSADKIAHTVRSYVELAGHGSADDLADLYADDATVEDPVGGDVHRGIDAIRGFCHAMKDGQHFEVALVSLNVAGGEAAFHFQVTSDGRCIDAIDVMTFDDAAKITSMRSYWGPSNIVAV